MFIGVLSCVSAGLESTPNDRVTTRPRTRTNTSCSLWPMRLCVSVCGQPSRTLTPARQHWSSTTSPGTVAWPINSIQVDGRCDMRLSRIITDFTKRSISACKIYWTTCVELAGDHDGLGLTYKSVHFWRRCAKNVFSSFHELIQSRGVRRLSVRPSVCKLLRKSLLLAGKWPDRHQTCTRSTPGQRASRVCSRSRSRSKVTWYGHFCAGTKIASSRCQIARSPPNLQPMVSRKAWPKILGLPISREQLFVGSRR